MSGEVGKSKGGDRVQEVGVRETRVCRMTDVMRELGTRGGTERRYTLSRGLRNRVQIDTLRMKGKYRV